MDDPSTSGTTEGFGLMFYNARWYDPALGRFAQADSVLDNPVTGWDRYSYVQNNPLKFIDPSGNKCEGDGCDSPVNFYHQSKVGTPDILARNILTKRANKLYDFYLRMYADKSGWWWDKYGEGGFTIWEFMAIQWGLERDWYPHAKNNYTALSNHAAVWCDDIVGCDMSMAEWQLNFLAEYSKRPFPGMEKCIYDQSCKISSIVREPPLSNPMQIVIAIQSRPSLVADPVGPGDLYDVGNVSLSSEIFRKMILKGLVYDAWGTGNTMIVLTKCQSDFIYYASSHGGARYINKSNYAKYCG